MVIHSIKHQPSTQPAADIHNGRPADPVYRERGEALSAEWAQTDATVTKVWA